MNIKEKMNETQQQYEELQEMIRKEEVAIENSKSNILSFTREIYVAQGKYQILSELDQESNEQEALEV